MAECGDLAAIVGSEPGVKVYRALLTQTGTDAPVATVLENSIGALVWTRNGGGTYIAGLVGAFPIGKVVHRVDGYGASGGLPFTNYTRHSETDSIVIETGADGELLETAVEILVYP